MRKPKAGCSHTGAYYKLSMIMCNNVRPRRPLDAFEETKDSRHNKKTCFEKCFQLVNLEQAMRVQCTGKIVTWVSPLGALLDRKSVNNRPITVGLCMPWWTGCYRAACFQQTVIIHENRFPHNTAFSKCTNHIIRASTFYLCLDQISDI